MENLNTDIHKIENAESIKSAQTDINFSIIFRIAQTALLALNLATSYSDEKSNLLRVYSGSNSYFHIIIPVILLDLILTVLWSYSKKINNIHFVMYIVFGGVFFTLYMMTASIIVTPWNLLVVYICLPGLWILGLIPFIIYKKASYKLMVEKIRYKK